MSHVVDTEPGIRASVIPAQSAFFAGETLSVTITFTNTRNPNVPAKRVFSHSHKRAAHSISSVPLARPPTSPITPRTAVPPLVTSTRSSGKLKKYERKGLIGAGVDGTAGAGDSLHVGSWKGKSMSVSLSPQELATVISPPTVSPLRDASLPPKHPHARKQSVLDCQLEAQLQLKELSSSPALAPSGSASTSAFSLSLDTISENSSVVDAHQYPPRKQLPQLGLGLGPPPFPSGEYGPPKSSLPSTFAQPGTELVLYAYAQLTGTLTLGLIQGESRTQAQALNAIRFALLKKQAVGGGRMDISSSLEGRPREPLRRQSSGRGHTRTSSLSSSLMSLISPPAPAWSPRHNARSPSLVASLISPSLSSPASIGNDGGTGLGPEVVEEVSPDTPLPTFEVQPTMLAVDLVLAPGESRSYTYKLPLPKNLPPTYRGRVVKFAYHLTVGVCRSSPGPTSGGRSSTSQVMRVPIRVYNHVNISDTQKPYDLLWPVLNRPGREQSGHVIETSSGPDGRKVSRARRGSTAVSPHQEKNLAKTLGQGPDPATDLRDYASRLLNSISDTSGDCEQVSNDIEVLSPTDDREYELRGQGGGELTGCREAVEILTRNMRKVSYDVNKDGVKVAVLTFTKSAYRLGETVVGVVELNEVSSRARVLKLSAMLEAHETLPSSLTYPQGQKKLRKLHAEYHAALTSSVLRTSFALDIPSDASPAFRYVCASPLPVTSGPNAKDGDYSPGGLSWTVRLCLLVTVASPHARCGTVGAQTKGLVRDGAQGEWGTAWRATRGVAPLQYIDARAARRSALAARATGDGKTQQRGWASYFLSGLLTPGEREYHDGDEDLDSDLDPEDGNGFGFDDTQTVRDTSGAEAEVDLGGGEDGWSELRAETVECEVPIRVWPGNTAFRPLEVVFDV